MGNLTVQHFDEPDTATAGPARPSDASDGPSRVTVRFFKVCELLHAQRRRRDQARLRGEGRAVVARLDEGVRALEIELADLRHLMLTPRRPPR